MPGRALLALVSAAGGPGALGRHVVEIPVAAHVVVGGRHASAVAGVHLPLPKTDSGLAFGKLITGKRNCLVVIVAVGTFRVSHNCVGHFTIDLHLRTGSYGTEPDAKLHLQVQVVLLGLSGLGRLR